MSKSGFVIVPLVLAVVAGLLITGGWAVHRIGWTEGYSLGTGVAAGEASAVLYAPTGLSYIGMFLTAGLALLVLMAFVSKLVGLWAFKTFAAPWMLAHRRAAGPAGPNAERWAAHWHTPHGHMPPWCWGWEPATDEKSSDGTPGTKQTDSQESS